MRQSKPSREECTEKAIREQHDLKEILTKEPNRKPCRGQQIERQLVLSRIGSLDEGRQNCSRSECANTDQGDELDDETEQ